MTTEDNSPDSAQEDEHFPLEPRYHPLHRIPRKIYDFLASAKLAMALLVVILGCCLAGVTVWREARAWELIFSTLWFNSLLVLLVVNVACCFFGRIWGRRVTLISFGMILFHISFVMVFLAIVYNSLFYFRGYVRLTEGETLPNWDQASYDEIDKGVFFSFKRLRGEITLLKMYTEYRIGGEDKRAAYEVEVGEGATKKRGVMYITNKLTFRGVDYFNDKEGYSLLVVMNDKNGRELYGAHIPLQSIKQQNGSYFYTTGYKDGKAVKQGPVPYPQQPEKPLYALVTAFEPSKLNPRGGDVLFRLLALGSDGNPLYDRLLAEGKVKTGEPFTAGEHRFSTKEVRYWVKMMVRYEPGKPMVLASLWIGFAGMIITTVGRMVRDDRARRQKRS